MDWYHVIKTINGQRYLYRQVTWRQDGRVKTRSEYIGRIEDKGATAPASRSRRKTKSKRTPDARTSRKTP